MDGSPLPLMSHSEAGLPAAVFSHATRLAVPGLSRHAGPGKDWFGGNGRSAGGGGGGGFTGAQAASPITRTAIAAIQRDEGRRHARRRRVAETGRLRRSNCSRASCESPALSATRVFSLRLAVSQPEQRWFAVLVRRASRAKARAAYAQKKFHSATRLSTQRGGATTTGGRGTQTSIAVAMQADGQRHLEAVTPDVFIRDLVQTRRDRAPSIVIGRARSSAD